MFYESIGANILIMTFFIAITRAIELVLKPIVAVLSDNYESRYGRRKPFILFGFIFYVIFLCLLFFPPINDVSTNKLMSNISFVSDLKEQKYFVEEDLNLDYSTNISIYFGVIYIIFFVFDTICNIPYQALAPELSDSPRDRERLYFVYYLIQFTGILFVVVSPITLQSYWLNVCDLTVCNYDEINNNHLYSTCLNLQQQKCNNSNNRKSLQYVAFIIAFYYIISIILMLFYVKEKHKKQIKESNGISHLLNIFNNKALKEIIIPYILDNIIISIFATMIPFYIKYVINPEDYCIKNQLSLRGIFCNSNLL